jgi:diacylglycerol kinase
MRKAIPYISAMGDSNYFQQRVRSFGYAFKGIATLFRTQAHAKIHALATVIVIGLGFALEVERGEWALLVVAICIVWTAEAFNTALEFLVDLVSPGQHPLAGKAKDVAAGAVLIAAIGAMVIGGIVFVPHVCALVCGT